MHAGVLVIGGGPIGAVAARCAAEAGAAVLLVDRRDSIDRASCCTGLVSLRTLATLGVSKNPVLHEIRRITVHAPDGKTLDLSADHTKAVVIDRIQLERELHALARAAGVDVRLGTEAVATSGNSIVLDGSNGQQEVKASAILGADGPGSRVADWFGLPHPEDTIRATQAVIETTGSVPTDRVEVFLGDCYAPGFFAWAVPCGSVRLRVGLGVTPPFEPVEYLDRLLDTRFSSCRVLVRSGGVVPISPTACSAVDSTFLVGDAAGQVKPLSGGGLYPGSLCARIAGRIAAEVALSELPRDGAADAYESEWRLAIGREIAFGRAIRRISGILSDRELSAAIAASDDPVLLSFLAERADIDRFYRLPDELATQPQLWGKILRLLPRIVNREIADLSDRSSVVSVPPASL